MTSSLLCDVTRSRLVITDVSIQPIPIGPHLQGSPSKMVPIGCPETSVTNYRSTLSNIVEERTSSVWCSLKSADTWHQSSSCWVSILTRHIVSDWGNQVSFLGKGKRFFFFLHSVHTVFWGPISFLCSGIGPLSPAAWRPGREAISPSFSAEI